MRQRLGSRYRLVARTPCAPMASTPPPAALPRLLLCWVWRACLWRLLRLGGKLRRSWLVAAAWQGWQVVCWGLDRRGWPRCRGS